MELALYVVNAVLLEGRSVREVARATGVSKSRAARWVALYRAGGPDALAGRKRGPSRAPNQMPLEVEDLVVALRKELSDLGVDAGARTIRYHLAEREGLAWSVSAIHRALVRRGFVVPEPHKRPRLEWTRFESARPNECWQVDMTHWALVDATPVEIVTVIDDYSRGVLACEAVTVATSKSVLALFRRCVERWGLPASMLSDNGLIFTAAYRHSHTLLEAELRALRVEFKHGQPYHPQTQGKVERVQRTLKKWLARRPRAETLAELQRQLDAFVSYYNEVRPHQRHGVPPLRAWRSLERATPTIDGVALAPHTRVRRDRVSTNGTVTLRYGGTLYHLSIGRRYAGRRVVALVADLDVRVLDEDGRLLRRLTLDPSRKFQPRG